jgi:uncharacterized protein
MPESRPPISLFEQSLADVAQAMKQRRLPPVEQWDPPNCGTSDIRIARDGSWYHQGRPIERPAMVRLFATVLRREPDGNHVLVTPIEKLTVEVELAAFVATGMKSEGKGRHRQVVFSLNSGDAVFLGPDHPLRLGPDNIPLLNVRGGLEASLARPVYYELAELALEESPDCPGIWGGGAFFALMPE